MAIPQADDFRAESQALFELLKTADARQFAEPTQFKSWTINTVLQHLHFWNQMARFQIVDEAELLNRMAGIGKHPGRMRGYEADHFNGLGGRTLLEAWHQGVQETADIFATADPKARLKWAGPDMSARSSITARLMETWAHGQEVYDHLGVIRRNKDRIQNIVVLGVNTFGWTYKARRQTPPGPMPHLVLTAPSGAVWTYGEDSEIERIEGSAEAFCQVVTQTRNVADTDLRVTGPIARDWMSKAQCFAGPPAEPPAPGTRQMREMNTL
ncbi:MAG: TIGR03084 family metal-binding protein [Henriciella sp.]|nr:TIGR03084 family metal-binding protein [Henriciella sp.]